MITDTDSTLIDKTIIGRAEIVTFPELGIEQLHARIDTGARTSAIWVSSVEEIDGRLKVVFLGDTHEAYADKPHYFDEYSQTVVTSSNGHRESRYRVVLVVVVDGKQLRVHFTLANRSTQVYPVLVGRNLLRRGKFIVDITKGTPLCNPESVIGDDEEDDK